MRQTNSKSITGEKFLSGRIAHVTGGAGGIGFSTARRLLEEGASVTLSGRTQERLGEAVEKLASDFGEQKIHSVPMDVTDEESVKNAFGSILERWGRLDILVNNAGISLGRSIEETSAEDYDRQNSVMPRGSFLCTREATKIFRDQGTGGDIVYIVSKNAMFAGPKNLAYGTAKAAQLHQMRLAAAELAEIGVRVNAVNPDGVVEGSGIFSGGWGADRAKAYGIEEKDLGKFYAQRTLLKKEILPEDIAAAVYVLVGPDLRKSTGLVINVDGGFAPTMPR